jgi:hypothetical protein
MDIVVLTRLRRRQRPQAAARPADPADRPAVAAPAVWRPAPQKAAQ